MDSNRYIHIDNISTTTETSNSHSHVRGCRDTELTSSTSVKRTKFNFRDYENFIVHSENQCHSEFGVHSLNDVVSLADSGRCDHVLSSPCFTHRLRLDLKGELRLQNATFLFVNEGFSGVGVTSPASEISMDSDKMESFSRMKQKPESPRVVTSRRKPPATLAKRPMAAEIEEFFSAAEKKEQKRFSDKYNFDIVNEVPMDGRYQWVRLKP